MSTKASQGRRAKSAKSGRVVKLRPEAKRLEIAKKAARASADARTTKAQNAVREAMRAIEAELVKAGGIEQLFPGGLSKKELATRAGINPRSLYTPNLLPLGQQVDAWVARLNGKEAEGADGGEENDGKVSKSRSLATRYADLKKRWDTVRQDIRDTKLAMQQVRSECERALAENAKLRQANAVLEAKVEALEKRESKVISFSAGRR